MKPIIIFTDNAEKITLTRQELESICKDAFEQGVEYGKSQGTSITWPNPITTPYQPVIYGTGDNPIRYDHITCSNNKESQGVAYVPC